MKLPELVKRLLPTRANTPPATFAFGSHVGRVRKNNEDAVLALDLGDGLVLVVVADGVGGQNFGEVASGIIVETFQEMVNAGKLTDMPPDESYWNGLLAVIAHEAHRNIITRALADPAYTGMASTLTAVITGPAAAAFAQVGDSRLYQWDGEVLTQITRDQTVANSLITEGRLRPEDYADHPGKNTLDHAMGLEGKDRPLKPAQGTFKRKPGDRIVLCSDGLTDMVTDAEIAALMREGVGARETVGKLIDAALDAGGKDNVTVVMVG